MICDHIGVDLIALECISYRRYGIHKNYSNSFHFIHIMIDMTVCYDMTTNDEYKLTPNTFAQDFDAEIIESSNCNVK